VVSALVAVDEWFGIERARAGAHAGLRERASLLAAVQAQALAAALWDYDDGQARAVLGALASDPDLSVARVLGPEGDELMAARGRAAASAGDLAVRRQVAYRDGPDLRALGTLEVLMSTRRLEAGLRREVLHRLQGAVLLLGAVLGAIALTFRRISLPLATMARVMGELAAGDHRVAVPALARGDEIGDIARAIDVFKENAAEVERLRASRERAAEDERLRIRAAVDSCGDAVAVVAPDGEPLYANRAFGALTGLDLAGLRAGADPLGLLADARTARAVRVGALRRGSWQGEARLRRRGREPVPVLLRVSAIRDAAGRGVGYVALAADVTERQAAEARVRHLAHHDGLTGLPNRLLFQERLAAALADARRSRRGGAVLLLDLDRFKEVNDSLGHPAGDELLREAAARLRGCAAPADTVARLGGDEFAIVQPGRGGGAGPAEAARALAGAVMGALARPFRVEGQDVHAGTSVGVALFPDDGAAAGDLLRRADMALYRAKAAGRGTSRFFEPAMEEEARSRKAVEGELRRALERDELELFYQPQVRLADGLVVGLEALVRWRHPTRGLVGPAEFVPVAEESGLILALGERVLDEACRRLRAWDADGRRLRVAVNLSPAQFRVGLAEAVERRLAAHGADPRRLELELTEGALLRDTRANVATLERLKATGVTLALDDFGTGYSSLGYLGRFPFDAIKIDRSFVAGLGRDAYATAIVRTVVGLGHELGMTVVAEGVETRAQLERLRDLGCDVGQGFLFGRPAAVADLDLGPREVGPARPRPARRQGRRAQGLNASPAAGLMGA
jgi:diguanylate cyclase (GGDEF)-like protein/PAS domain S-box-containing protein